MKEKLSKCLAGFRKSRGTQSLLVTMLEKWKKAIDKGEYVSALFTDLSKAFDTSNHDLFVSKIIQIFGKAYRFSLNAVKLIHSLFKKQKSTSLN